MRLKKGLSAAPPIRDIGIGILGYAFVYSMHVHSLVSVIEEDIEKPSHSSYVNFIVRDLIATSTRDLTFFFIPTKPLKQA
jgi:hypothetical protein